MNHFTEILADTAVDCLKLLPFLFLTYLLMELLEHNAGGKLRKLVEKAGRKGPLVGALAGALPQCGFSAAASSLYAGNVITVGTLLSIFLSTSDEMIPVFLSHQTELSLLFRVLALKIILGMSFGFLTDFTVRKMTALGFLKRRTDTIEELCEQEHCQCSDGPVRSACRHTVRIFVFLFIILLILNMLTDTIGLEAVSSVFQKNVLVQTAAAGLIGLIPNCAASVFLTEMYLNGILSFGGMMSGLLVGAGVGLLVLFRTHRHLKKNLEILALLYGFGVCGGIICSLFGM